MPVIYQVCFEPLLIPNSTLPLTLQLQLPLPTVATTEERLLPVVTEALLPSDTAVTMPEWLLTVHPSRLATLQPHTSVEPRCPSLQQSLRRPQPFHHTP